MMTPEEPEAKATVQLLYREIGSLREEVYNKFGDLGESLERRFSEVLVAIDNLRGSLVPQNVCSIKHQSVEASIDSAVESSENDRQKLWESVHGIEAQLKWAAASIVLAFLGIIGYIIQAHL